ncbi:hypothetical protein [Phosphitispora fastidiosa]|uniref:hypothetical protein n=1 Tax=Phosphitispora fastidiosa TaxID=2837202 RepID=UPI001E456B65|nr:hypothetical protein [Phosphitispora fastidiosa]MBU7006349.1 hypothetical protein [Phosphitispora fastidiosa]
MSTQLATVDNSQVGMMLAGMDTSSLTEEQKAELAAVMQETYEDSKQGFNFKPQRFKINKDNQTFTDPLGNPHEELKGVAVFKQITRGYWDRSDDSNKVPICSSIDGITGTDRDKNSRPCVTCPQNQWGSAATSERDSKGKACKEMRRAFIIPSGQFVPIMVSLPPTSLKTWDNFWSARITQGIPDLMAEVILALIPAQINGYDISVVKCKSGTKVPPLQILELNKVRNQFKDAWSKEDVTDEDYETGDAGSAGAEAQQTIVDDGEPY